MSSDEIKAKFGGKWKVYKSENFEELLKDIGKFCLTFLFTFVFTKQKEGKKKKKKKNQYVFLFRLSCCCSVLTILNRLALMTTFFD